jgi:predicted TIM-barrel fold metal-dependent hydrolase
MDAAGVDAAVVVSAALSGDLDNNEYVAGAVALCPGRLYQLVDVDSRWSPSYHQAGAADRLAAVCDRLDERSGLVAGRSDRPSPAGVSHYLAASNDGWLPSDEGRAFFAVASRRGLIVGLAAAPTWFADIRSVAASFPATPVLLNHLALVMLHPDGVAAALDIVRKGAGQPNLIVKVSGYYYDGSGPPSSYPFADRLEIVRAFYETWGPHRMVWASDYPASAPHITYRQSLDVIREHAAFIAPPDLPLVLGGTMQALLTGTRPDAR